jgi:hypothetical protein
MASSVVHANSFQDIQYDDKIIVSIKVSITNDDLKKYQVVPKQLFMSYINNIMEDTTKKTGISLGILNIIDKNNNNFRMPGSFTSNDSQ